MLQNLAGPVCSSMSAGVAAAAPAAAAAPPRGAEKKSDPDDIIESMDSGRNI